MRRKREKRKKEGPQQRIVLVINKPTEYFTRYKKSLNIEQSVEHAC